MAWLESLPMYDSEQYFLYVGNRTNQARLRIHRPQEAALRRRTETCSPGRACKARTTVADAAYYRAQAELSFQIAALLSDHIAAEDVRNTARRYLRRAEELERVERVLK